MRSQCNDKSSASSRIIKIAITAIALGIVMMLISLSTSLGLQHEIRNKINTLRKTGNIKDASKKASDLISFAVKKTGDAVNDAALKIYVAATSKLQASIAKIKVNEKDKKRGLMFTIVNKIISFFVKNPKLTPFHCLIP